MIEMILGVIVVSIVLVVMIASALYKVVEPTEAHLVTTESGRFVASSDEKLTLKDKDGNEKLPKKAYYAIPSSVPFFGTQVRVMDVTIKDINVRVDTIEKNQARFIADTSTKYRIKDVETAAETFSNDEQVQEQLQGIIASSVRAVTVKFDVVEARGNKQKMEEEIKQEMQPNFNNWGLELVNFQVTDFKDTDDSKIISNISERREAEIESDTRINVAEKIKLARLKEAESEEASRQREIQRDQRIGEQEQLKNKAVSEQQKEAQEKAYEVIRVNTIQQANIDKEKAIVLAKQNVETEQINKERKRLEGEGDRLKQEEQAKGLAAPIREQGLANAEAKEKLQAALNKFQPNAIQALTAELQVQANKEVGIATANALKEADIKVLAGGDHSGLDLAKLVESMSVASPNVAGAFMTRLAQPNSLGFQNVDLNQEKKQ